MINSILGFRAATRFHSWKFLHPVVQYTQTGFRSSISATHGNEIKNLLAENKPPLLKLFLEDIDHKVPSLLDPLTPLPFSFYGLWYLVEVGMNFYRHTTTAYWRKFSGFSVASIPVSHLNSFPSRFISCVVFGSIRVLVPTCFTVYCKEVYVEAIGRYLSLSQYGYLPVDVVATSLFSR